MKCPNGMSSWEFFDYLLQEIQVVGTPGEGFGACGEGYFRFSTFGDVEETKEAARRMKELFGCHTLIQKSFTVKNGNIA